jgi:hypothetical protein
MIISTDQKKVLKKSLPNQDFLKSLSNLGIEVNFLNLFKDSYKNPTANVCNDVKLTFCPLCLHHPVQRYTGDSKQHKNARKIKALFMYFKPVYI